MGMKEITEKMEIVTKEKAEYLDKIKNVSITSELNNNHYLIKYSGNISDQIRKLYKKDPLISKKNGTIIHNKLGLTKLGLNKSRTVPSAVHIAAAISAYARILINEFKNIPGNPCVMSDTDSAVLTKPLAKHLVGEKLGQMKLVHEIKIGMFVKRKLYFIQDSNNKEIIKSSGIDSSKLNFDSFTKLLNGETIEIERTVFNVEWKTLEIKVENSKTLIQGLKGKIKTLYNTPDVNFKFISFPKKYELVVHPKFPLNPRPENFSFEIKKVKYQINKNCALFPKGHIILIYLFLFISYLSHVLN